MKSEAIHETGLSGKCSCVLFPLKMFIPLYFNVLSTVPRENRLADSLYISISISISISTHIIDQARGKMAGYWPSFLFAFLWTLNSSRSIKMQKENEANI